jgi:GxxExxY protein
VDELAHEVIGAALEVHRLLGPGYIEAVYEQALCIELGLRGIPFARQHVVQVRYKGHMVGEGRLDLLIGNSLVVELKAADRIDPVYTAQLLSYLKATGFQLGLLINFNVPILKTGIRRVILSK